MTVQKLKRVMQRVRYRNPQKERVNLAELQRSIMLECGTTRATYYSNKRALVKLGWIRMNGQYFMLTDKDLTEDYV